MLFDALDVFDDEDEVEIPAVTVTVAPVSPESNARSGSSRAVCPSISSRLSMFFDIRFTLPFVNVLNASQSPLAYGPVLNKRLFFVCGPHDHASRRCGCRVVGSGLVVARIWPQWMAQSGPLGGRMRPEAGASRLRQADSTDVAPVTTLQEKS